MKRTSAGSVPLFELFHFNTQYTRATAPAHSSRIARHLFSPQAVAAQSRNFKVFRFARQYALPPPRAPGMPLSAALRARVSTRAFTGEMLSLEALAGILIPAAGCNRMARAQVDPQIQLRFRSYPSGGAEYPLEIYPILLRVAGHAPAVTHFGVRDGVLSVVHEPLDPHAVERALIQPAAVLESAAVLLVITAVFGRSTEKYGDRGYRLILLEAGHLAQNLCLTAAASGCGSLAWGGFYDREVNHLVGADGLHEAAIHCLFLGGAPPAATPAAD